MLDEKKINNIQRALQRIFAMSVTKSTFREVQNAFANVLEGNREEANQILEIILRGDAKLANLDGSEKEAFEKVIENFSVPLWTAKEVHEKGDFINLISSDILSQNNQVLCANILKKIDGEEFRFLTDPESTLQLVSHFLSRIAELEKNDRTRPVVTRNRAQLETLKQKLEELLGAARIS
jgi:hypothetical protein